MILPGKYFKENVEIYGSCTGGLDPSGHVRSGGYPGGRLVRYHSRNLRSVHRKQHCEPGGVYSDRIVHGDHGPYREIYRRKGGSEGGESNWRSSLVFCGAVCDSGGGSADLCQTSGNPYAGSGGSFGSDRDLCENLRRGNFLYCRL